MLFPFAEYEKRAKKMTIAELFYAKRDAYRAAQSLKGADVRGKDENWYMDECHTYGDEIRRRQKNV